MSVKGFKAKYSTSLALASLHKLPIVPYHLIHFIQYNFSLVIKNYFKPLFRALCARQS